MKRSIFFHPVHHPTEMCESEITAFRTYLAMKERVSASTQNQALGALLFLYRHVLGRKARDPARGVRAREPKGSPAVLTRQAVKALRNAYHGKKCRMAWLAYGAGMRLMECLRFRVEDIDFEQNDITVGDGQGAKWDRIMILPKSLKTPLQNHLQKVKGIHENDLRDGCCRGQMPGALDREHPHASPQWQWHWVFPQEHRWINPKTEQQKRRHVHESIVQKSEAGGGRGRGIDKVGDSPHFLPLFRDELFG